MLPSPLLPRLLMPSLPLPSLWQPSLPQSKRKSRRSNPSLKLHRSAQHPILPLPTCSCSEQSVSDFQATDMYSASHVSAAAMPLLETHQGFACTAAVRHGMCRSLLSLLRLGDPFRKTAGQGSSQNSCPCPCPYPCPCPCPNTRCRDGIQHKTTRIVCWSARLVTARLSAPY